MELKLNLKSEEKIYTSPFISSRNYRTLMVFDQEIDYMDMTVEDTDKIAGFVCSVFGDQFTVDQFYDGTPSHHLLDTFLDVFAVVRGGRDPGNRYKDPEDDQGNAQGE